MLHFSFKLVRDRIVEKIQNNGGHVICSELKGQAYRNALLDKLVEEAQEVAAAKTHEHRCEEIADVLEVLIAIRSAYCYPPGDLEHIRQRKAHKFGTFAKGVKLYLSWGDKSA